jgi:adenosine deaminase
MSTSIAPEFIRAIPKTDLHVHLDGSLRISTLLELAKQEGVELPANDEAGLKELVFKEHYASLPEYLHGFAYTCAVLQNAENLERVAYELGQDNLAEGVRYVEVRFAPQLHCHDQFSLADVVRAVANGLDRAKREHNQTAAVKQGEDIPFEYGIIICAMRSFNEHMSDYYRKMLRLMSYARKKEVFAAASLEIARAAVSMAQRDGLPVVGFDLAGEEAGYPAGDHREAFGYAHKNFLRKTIHAGEAYGPESIFQAITDCHANRIGHGTFLFAEEMIQDPSIEDPALYTKLLAEYIASQRIAIEVNLTSNLQTTPSIKSVADHPVRKMIERNLSVSICTDNRLVSRTSVSREFEILVESIPVTRQQFRNLVISGFKGSFFPGSYNDKRRYVRAVINRYEQLERDLLGE